MYQTISDEMVKMFSTIKDFNNLVGEPVNKYRHEYKDMAKLRQLFYERVGNTPDLDKYVDFYKWIDITLDTLLGYLVPISADMSDQYGSNVRTMVENTVLHRNKYAWQYPTLEDKTPTIEGNILGINELLYDWNSGHAELLNTKWSNNSLLFVSGSGNALTVPDTTDLSFGDGSDDVAFSVGFWMKWAAIPSGDEHFFNKGDGGTAQEYDVYFKKSSNRVLVVLQDGTNAKKEWAEFAFDPATYVGNWTHVVVTYDGAGGTSARNGIKLYVNGAAVSAATTNGINYVAMENTSELFRIASAQQGSATSTGYTFNGNLDEFVVYKSLELSAAQVSTLYNTGCPRNAKALGTATSLVAYWKMGDDDTVAAGKIRDFSGNGHDATPRKSSGSDLTIVEDTPGTCLRLASTTQGCLWWDERAEKSNESITSLNVAVDSNKQTIQDSIVNETNASAPTLGTKDPSSGAISTYQGSTYATRRLAKPLRLKVEESPIIKGGVNEAPNKQADLLLNAFIKHNTPTGSVGSHIKIPSTSVESFKNCNDDLALNNGKRKQTFNSTAVNPNFGALESSYLNAKGDMYTPFDIYSSSAGGGYRDAISSSFKANIDITNLHEDSYGPLYGRPMQTPFTEKFVGGKVHRHIYSNLRPNNSSPDGALSRPEGWKIKFSASSLYLFGGGCNDNMTPNPHIEKGAQHRDEFAKRPVNIRNIKMFTGSSTPTPGRPDQVLNATNIGNYTNNYEVVMTNGRSINNRFLAEAPDGLPSAHAESTAISGVVDFALPRRDLTGSSKSIIVNRFSAPGDPITMGEGFLDTAAAEYSIYNALPWRNLSVRQPLSEWYTDHATQFGFFSDAQTVADYAAAGIAYPHQTGSISGTGSYHKTNRNPIRVKKFSSATSTSSFIDDVAYDNWFVQHPIPRTDIQYTWITASVISATSSAAFYDYQQPDYANSSLASTDILFVSGGQWNPSDFGGVSGPKIDFAGINSIIYDPIVPSENLLSASSGDYRVLFGVGLAQASVLNGLILHRQGAYGWPSWKHIRGAQHPVMRYNYKNNIQTFTKVVTTNVSNEFYGEHKEIVSQSVPPITSKFDPLKYKVTYNSDQPFSHIPSDAAVTNPQTTNMWTSYGNEKVYFTDVPDPSISGLINLNNSNLVWSKAGQAGQTLQTADTWIWDVSKIHFFITI